MPNFFKKNKIRLPFWETLLGQALVADEMDAVAKLISTLFGSHLLLLGEQPFLKVVKKSPIQHPIWIKPRVLSDTIVTREMLDTTALSVLQARHDKLPIQSDGIDFIYLAHCLEFVVNPHEVLRESYRTLVPEGHLMITCFNPWSLWGFCRRFFSLRNKVPWNGQFISVLRLKDWLALLGFDMIQYVPFFFRPPINHLRTLERLRWLDRVGRWCWPFGSGAYVVLARKRTITLTPIRPIFQRERKTVSTTASVTAEFSRDRDGSA